MSLKIRYNNHSVTFCGANVDAPSLTIQSSIGIQAYLRRFEILKDFNDGYKVAVKINRGTYWATGYVRDNDTVTIGKGKLARIDGLWDRISKYIRDYTDRICQAISDRRTINAARPVERKVNYNFLDTDTARYTARIQSMDNCDYGSHPADVAHVHGSKLGERVKEPRYAWYWEAEAKKSQELNTYMQEKSDREKRLDFYHTEDGQKVLFSILSGDVSTAFLNDFGSIREFRAFMDSIF